MLDFSVSVIPLAALAAVNFALSWIWYSPALFAKPWLKALGWSLDMEMSDEDRRQMPWLFFSGVIHSLLFVYGLMVVVHSLRIETFAQGTPCGRRDMGRVLPHAQHQHAMGRPQGDSFSSSTTDSSF